MKLSIATKGYMKHLSDHLMHHQVDAATRISFVPSSFYSLNGIFGRALNELINLSGESKVPKFMSFFFLQQITEEKAFANILRDQAGHVRNCLEKLHVMIYEMRKVRSMVGNDSLDFLREIQQMENNKLKALTDLIAQTEDAIRKKEGHVDIMKLSE
ncbi:hypothetical protein Tco_0195145 [Tanacetum coccineum]